ncbi:MAG: Mth938-like domain-containing protein [Salaquimonas sp.]|jgi:uncharacterized protein|nr:Mth938-like domain-containing protein [Salaquimonas sp.]
MAGSQKQQEPPSTGGFELRPAHYPGRAPIDAYGNGGFRFADMSHHGSLLMLPSGIYAWNLAAPADLTLESFSQVIAEASDVEVLLVGTGRDIAPLQEVWRQKFRECMISADAMATGAAVRTYNVLLAEGRAVAAALIAVD